jgi:hypothetical protein
LGDGFADENDDGIITADELGGFIKNRVVVDVDGAHTPQKGRIGSDMGEFVFISETLNEQIADHSPDSEQLSDLESEMAEIKKLLQLQAQGRGAQEINDPTQSKGRNYNYPAKIKTASKLAWVFPGMGHYYSGRIGKGLLFTGLEIISIGNVVGFSSEISQINEEYQTALENISEAQANNKLDDYNNYKAEAKRLLNKKITRQAGLITAGSVAAGVWLWNTRDVKKMKANNYSHANRFSVGVNRYGQIEARYRF